MRLVWIIVAVVVIGAIIGALAYFGKLPSWQELTIIGAAIAGPFKALFDSIGGKDKVSEIIDKHARIREEDEEYRRQMDEKVREQQEKLSALDKEIEVRNAKLEALEEKKKRVAAETKALTLDQTKSEAQNLFGE